MDFLQPFLQSIGDFLATLDVDKIAWFIFLAYFLFRIRDLTIEDLIRLITAWRTSIVQSPSLEDDKLLPALNAIEVALNAILQLFPQLDGTSLPISETEITVEDGATVQEIRIGGASH